ncbi:MAG: alpha/beta hydrolase [Woeseiaceae bacterium]|nr:alpha/beta hydrolase [Woeseiaceae bacterium]
MTLEQADSPGTKPIDSVICVHGFWSHGNGMVLIKRHFVNEYGWNAMTFSYPSVKGSLDENADLLAKFIEDEGLERCHIVGHSLGGVLTLRMLSRSNSSFAGRVVCLGSPLSGSRAAHFLSRQNWAEQILGRSLPEGTIHSVANEWAGEVCERVDVGVVAGSIPVGIGQIAGGFNEPNDGTVAVSETQLDGARDHITMAVSHMGMLISRAAADQAAAFLKRGEFLRNPLY